MKRIMQTALLLSAVIALCGCSATNITKFAQAIAKDRATWRVNISTIYGSGTYTRLGAMEGQSVTANSDGSITTVWLWNPGTNFVRDSFKSLTNSGSPSIIITNVLAPTYTLTPAIDGPEPTPPAAPSKPAK